MVSALLVYLVIASNIGSVKSSMTVPRTSVVLIGERVELKCSVTVNDTASWRYTSLNSSTETNIYLGRDIMTSMRSRYKIDKRINGQRNLIIDYVDLAHAGRYQCDGLLQPLINDIQLIVLGSHPVCVASISVAQNKVTEYPHLSIWCIISYTGNGIPVFNWTKSNADKSIAANTTTSDTSQVPFTSTSLITQQLQANDSGITFNCRITFQTSNTFQENPVDAYEYMRNFTLPILLSSITSVMSQSSFTDPGISVAVIGDKVEMNCSEIRNFWNTWAYPPYRYISWTHISWNSSTERDIYVYEDILDSMRSRYTIDRRFSGQHNLIIDSVDFAHAGRYRCAAGIPQTLSTDMQLIVLGSQPVCAANISAAKSDGRERNHLPIWCSISYTGNGDPVFNWTKGNAEKNIAANTTTFGSSLFTTTSLIVPQLHATDYGVAFQCRITFDFSNNSERVYVYTLNYTLPHWPRNIRIVENKDRLECSADGDPAPTYRWTRVDTKSSMEGHMILLDDNDQIFQCTATNVFGSERKNFTITKDERSVMIYSVGLVVISSILIVFGIVLLLVGLKLRKLSSAFDEDKTSTNASSFPPHQSSKQLNSPSLARPTCNEYAEMERADASDNTYCALEKQSTAAQKTEVYCELRPIDKRNIKQSSKQRAENKHR